jgi:hypothetical protein
VSSQLEEAITLPERLCEYLWGSCQNVMAFLLGIFMGTWINNCLAHKAVLLSCDMQ